jgi:probable HAF family extracellular repeat protein
MKFVIRRTAEAALLTVALAAALPTAQAAPAVAHWTVTDLTTASNGQFTSQGGINNAGQVAGNYLTPWIAAGRYHAALYDAGRFIDLGSLGGDSSATALNDAGQVTGYSYVNGVPHAFLYSNGVTSDLAAAVPGTGGSYGFGINGSGLVAGTFTGSNQLVPAVFGGGRAISLGAAGGIAYGINDSGQVTGRIGAGTGMHAFIYSNGSMTDLGTLGGQNSVGNAINNAGQVTGNADTAPDLNGSVATRAFLYSNGAMTDLGTFGGTFSQGSSINRAGLVVGYAADIFGASHAFLYSNSAMHDLNSFNGVASSGLTLISATGINDVGQVVGMTSSWHSYLATLDTVVWEGGSDGSWDATAGWSYGINPNKNTAVYLDPAQSLTVTGPAGAVTVKSLNIGGDASGNSGVATLTMAGGVLTVTGKGGSFTTISQKGVLMGDGAVTGAVTNLGTVNATNLTLPGGLLNQGIVTGSGRLNTDLNNTANGTVQLGAGQSLQLSGTAHVNSGIVQLRNGADLRVAGSFANNGGADVDVTGGSTARFDSATDNQAGGRFVLDNATVRYGGGLTNAGQLLVSYGGATVFGPVTTVAGGQIIMSANSNSSFYGTVDVRTGGELRVSTGSTATFFGLVQQRTGSVFSGSGSSLYEGGLSVGASPGMGINEGNVSFGGGNVYLAEIGGLTACTAACATDDALKNSSFDKYIVKGRLTMGGTLKLVSWNDFVARPGMSFDLLDWGSVGGAFASIDASGLQLAPGARLDLSQLYATGEVRVAAVPEPESWILMLGGCIGIGIVRNRRCRRDSGAA